MGIFAAATVAATGAVVGGVISASGQRSAAKDANRQREAAYERARGTLSGIAGRGSGFLEAAFGSELNPEAFLYHKVDLSKSQMDTIRGNIKAFPKANELTNMVNPSIWANDLDRIRTMMPQFDKARSSYLGTTRRLQEGQLPFDDVMDITSRSSSLSGSTGTPGGGRNATLRDLGLSRLDAMEQGNSMFAQFMQVAEQISPTGSQMRPQQMMFTPQERAQMDIEQAALDQQGRASAELARAMPDPAQAALVNAEMGIEMASIGSAYAPTGGAGAAALGAGIAGASQIIGGYMARNNQQPAPSMAAPPPAYPQGGGYIDDSLFPTTGTNEIALTQPYVSSFDSTEGFYNPY